MGDKTKTLTFKELKKQANDIRVSIIKMVEAAGSGHPGGSLGLADIFTALYFDVMNCDPKNPDWGERDILLLSNGHCVPVQYATMAHAGFFDTKELITLRKHKSRLQGHPERHALPGLENTSGPLGCGLSQACGMALAMRMNKQTNRYIYVVMGDGELDEGNVWEAAMLAPKYNLNNIIGIVDRNNIQIDGPTENIMPLGDLKQKWEAFGWNAVDIDGNNIEAVISAIDMAKAVKEKPTVLIARTTPGKGVSFMENDYHWHGVAPNADQAKVALDDLHELGAKIESEHE
ncbi:transketolase [Candidatus Saccharibacteria bacterium RIFCSPHIGHO2_12_FULL_41_12]|nr:MAG: transketolase [Candidatus Saccharibacteria bacterium RIFCSPHIGHO2_12_FULL_41_12]